MSPSGDAATRSVLRKAAWRLMPFLCLLYVFNILDRSNLGFARLGTMQRDLELSEAVFDIGFGIFYLGYLLFEVPANLLLRRVGARLWIARIMITWGLVSAATAAVTGPTSFYIVRILLGVAEAGFFPGIVLYLTYWFSARERATMVALFMLAIPLSGILSNPLSGAILQWTNGLAGLAGWQWLFMLEGLPSILLGMTVYVFLPDGPHSAPWLSDEEKAVVQAQLDEPAKGGWHVEHLWPALLHWRVWLLIALYTPLAVTANASGAHLPRLIRDQFPKWTTLEIGLLTSLPHVAALVAMTLVARNSDRTGKRRGHVAFAALMGASGWALAWLNLDPWTVLLGLCVAQAGIMSMLPTFWAIPTMFLHGAAAAGGIALINSVGNIGGIYGPWLFGYFGSFGPLVMVTALVLGAMLTAAVRIPPSTANRV